MNIQNMIIIAIRAALDAGNAIMQIYDGKNFDISFKADQSPLTSADRAAHSIISNELEKTNIPLLSEEGKTIPYHIRKEWEYFWMIDPLDGTKEFIQRNGEFTVNIALIHNTLPIAGVVYIPISDELYYNDGSHSFYVHNASKKELEELLCTQKKLPLHKNTHSFVIAASRSHMSNETKLFIENIDSKGQKKAYITKGSSIKICMVAEGSADIYPRLAPTMEWDTAAGHAIALGAGKTIVSHPENTPLKYNKENLLNPYFIVQ